MPVFVAHNARFDYGFLRAEFRRAGLVFSSQVLCTVKLSRRLFPEHLRHNLDAVMQRHGLACDARHRALGDARVIRDFWLGLCRDIRAETLAAATFGAMGAIKLPPQLPEGLADELPEGPGMYRFFGEADTLLYVGRGGSLRAAILGHFTEGGVGGRDGKLKDQVRRVEWEETAGELGALLLELEALKTHDPSITGISRRLDGSVTLRLAGAPPAVAIVPIDELDPSGLDGCFGVFHAVEGCAQGARGHRAGARALHEASRARGGRGLLHRAPARPLQGCVRRQGAARAARRSRADGARILEVEGMAVSRTCRPA